jgi:hypothetical protein
MSIPRKRKPGLLKRAYAFLTYDPTQDLHEQVDELRRRWQAAEQDVAMLRLEIMQLRRQLRTKP